jgi:methionine-rich copper-binding protein CopC
VRRALVVLLLLPVLLAPALTAGPASAHAALVGTDPADEAVVEEVPGTVTLEFNEPVTRSELVLTAPDGSRVPLDVSARDREVTGRLRDGTADGQRGTYTIAYRVVSADGHPIAGESTFRTTAGRTVEQAPRQDDTSESFIHRHAEHLWWAVGGGLVAVVLIVWPLLRRRTEEHA